jgi:hypothetical protein
MGEVSLLFSFLCTELFIYSNRTIARDDADNFGVLILFDRRKKRKKRKKRLRKKRRRKKRKKKSLQKLCSRLICIVKLVPGQLQGL